MNRYFALVRAWPPLGLLMSILVLVFPPLAGADDGLVLRDSLSRPLVVGGRVPEVPAPDALKVFASPLTLAQAVLLALEQNRIVLSAVLDRGLQQQDLMLAEAEFGLKFSLSGQTNRLLAETDTSSGSLAAESTLRFATGGQLTLSTNQTMNTSSGAASARAISTALKLVQPLLKGNASVAALSAQGARLTETIGRLQYEQLLSNTVANVVIAYCDARQADVQVDMAQQALQRIVEIQAVNTALYHAGRLAQQDLLQFEVDIAQSKLTLEQARNTAEVSKRRLLQQFGLMGARTPVQDLQLSDVLPSPATAAMTESAALVLAFASREDIRVAELALDLARFRLRKADNELLPQVDLVAGVEKLEPVSGIAGRTDANYSVGFSFSVPIDDKVSKVGLYRARVDIQKAEWALEDLRLDVKNQVLTSVREVRFAESQLVLATRSLELSKKRLDNELEKLKAGRTSTFQLSAAQDSLRQAQVAWGVAQLAVPRAQLQLHRDTGQVQAQWNPIHQQRRLP